jgi:Ca-activated chloride channel homolog
MSTTASVFGERAPELTCKSGTSPILERVSIQGRLQGLLMHMQVQQHYVNNSDDEVEVVYTFPVAFDAVLLGLSVEINGKRLHGEVKPKAVATERYEEAIASGDTPVMVELAGDGLYSANLGNLLPGEHCTLDITIGQTLRLEQGKIRVSIPTTVAPRFGDSHIQGGLAPHQTVDARLDAHYGFDLSIDLFGDLAKATIQCPSHLVDQFDTEEGKGVRLAATATLDRDFVLVLSDLPAQSFAMIQPTEFGHSAMLSFTPAATTEHDRPLRLKVLVDCSGSMSGDSIAQARAALLALGTRLRGSDMVSLSRFGSNTEHIFRRLMPATDALMECQWIAGVDRIQADLGGTELTSALQQCFDLARPTGEDGPLDVLLITDGEVWSTRESIDAAQLSGHRIFAVGVGSAVAESLLRELAEATGGACEFVSPNENIGAAVIRVFHRLRRGQQVKLEVNWGAECAWQSATPRLLVPDETVHLFAEFANRPDTKIDVTYQLGANASVRQEASVAVSNEPWLSRLAGARRYKESHNAEERAELANQHQLVSEHTNLLLVYERAEGEKAQGMPILASTPHMLAAGWGGSSSLQALNNSIQLSSSEHALPRVWFSMRRDSEVRVDALTSGGMDDFEIPAFLRKACDETEARIDRTSSAPSTPGKSIRPPTQGESSHHLKLRDKDELELLWTDIVDAALENSALDDALNLTKSLPGLSNWIEKQLASGKDARSILALIGYTLQRVNTHISPRLAPHILRQLRHLAIGFPVDAIEDLAALVKDLPQTMVEQVGLRDA